MAKVKQSFNCQLPVRSHQNLLSEFKDAVSSDAYQFNEHQSFGVAYLLAELESKYSVKTKSGAQQRRQAAVDKWLDVERHNAEYNLRLYGIDDEECILSHSFDAVLELASKFVVSVIGYDVPHPRHLNGCFSGGASTSKRREPGVLARKYVDKAHVTLDAWPYVLPILLEASYGWCQLSESVLSPDFVQGNVLFTVPKNAMIDRVACKEPDLNMFAQKACGNFIRQRLKRFGIDLDDQTVNQRGALQGSKDDSFATLDLSSASDTLSTSIVARLLPPDWFTMLDALRCKETCIDGVWHENQMFSSMGNGFTFELESLIFWALTRAVCCLRGVKGRIVVYGDDIIVPCDAAVDLMEVLNRCGFLVNPKKSFWYGAFRESCGKHYLDGLDITPFYVREDIKTFDGLIHFLNQMRAWAVRLGINYGPLYHLWCKWAKLVPRKVWGGVDTAYKNRLVSPHRGRFRLVQERQSLARLSASLENGFYLSWLNSPSRSKTVLMNEISEDSKPRLVIRVEVETHRWRIRRIECDPTWEPVLLSEDWWWIEEL